MIQSLHWAQNSTVEQPHPYHHTHVDLHMQTKSILSNHYLMDTRNRFSIWKVETILSSTLPSSSLPSSLLPPQPFPPHSFPPHPSPPHPSPSLEQGKLFSFLEVCLLKRLQFISHHLHGNSLVLILPKKCNKSNSI